jgi:CRP/FNR family cyclic AMP-dependent transcriptional regulator
MNNSLSTVSFLTNLNTEDMDALMARATQVEVAANTNIFQEGDAPDAMYIVLSGSLKVFGRGARGVDVVFATLGRGDHFGEMAVIDGAPRSASVSTLQASALLRLDAAQFEDCLRTNFRMVQAVISTLSARLRLSNARTQAFQNAARQDFKPISI